MRKEDRVAANRQQNRPQDQAEQMRMHSDAGEEVKGRGSEDRPAKPQRQDGKLPLPD